MRLINHSSIFYAILAALLFSLSSPFSKILLEKLPPTQMAAMLYLGAGLGMSVLYILHSKGRTSEKEARLTKKELPYILGMILLDVAAPVFLMLGLTRTTAASASLLGNFEVVATALIALVVFQEVIGKRLWWSIFLICFGCLILSLEDMTGFTFSSGSLFVLMASICWGFENNCTRMLSLKNPMEIVILKGFGSGFGALLICFITGNIALHIPFIAAACFLGFISYGLSIFFYVRAQRDLGAARTGAYYAFAPFLGVLLSVIVNKETLTMVFFIALLFFGAGVYLASSEKHKHVHTHSPLVHEHRHSHDDGHHTHSHSEQIKGEHSHSHSHAPLTHEHPHTPDLHHTHSHD